MLKEREVQELLQDFTYTEPLLPRDAYYGGRTGACKMYYKAKPGEKIYYMDFTSLYPAVMHRGQGSRGENVKGQNGFPIGKPTIITNPEDQDITNYFGIAKVTVTPPNDLYHPLLPYRANNKLLFPLCRSCAEHNSSLSKKDGRCEIRRCSHSTTERQWTGTYCTCELIKAEEMGYKIDRIHQVWHFEESSFDLFKTYIESFLRYKQEAAGYPIGCDTPEEQQAYIDDYLQNQGISLRPDNIKVNPGLKKTAKIALNSFYGKWGQRSNLPSRKYVDSVGKFWYYLESDDYVVHDCRVISDDCMEIYHTKPDAFVLPARHTNVVIAAWTTSLARLKLYDLLIEVGQRTLYYDTDSLIFTSDLDLEHENIPMGNYLGDLTD